MTNQKFKVINAGLSYYKDFFGDKYRMCRLFDNEVNEEVKEKATSIVDILTHANNNAILPNLDFSTLIKQYVVPLIPDSNKNDLFFYTIHLATPAASFKQWVFITTDFCTIVFDNAQIVVFSDPNPEFNNSDKVLSLSDKDVFKCLYYGAYRKSTNTQFFINCSTFRFEVIYPEKNEHSSFEFFPVRKYSDTHTLISKSLSNNMEVIQRCCDKFGHITLNTKVNNTQTMTMDGMSIGVTLKIQWSKDSTDYIILSIRGEIPNITNDGIELPSFNAKVTSITSDCKSIEFVLMRNKPNVNFLFDHYHLTTNNDFTTLDHRNTYAMTIEQIDLLTLPNTDFSQFKSSLCNSFFEFNDEYHTSVLYNGIVNIMTNNIVPTIVMHSNDELIYRFQSFNNITGVKVVSDNNTRTDKITVEGFVSKIDKPYSYKDELQFVANYTIHYPDPKTCNPVFDHNKIKIPTDLTVFIKSNTNLTNVRINIAEVFDDIRIEDMKGKRSSIINHIKPDTWYSVSFSL